MRTTVFTTLPAFPGQQAANGLRGTYAIQSQSRTLTTAGTKTFSFFSYEASLTVPHPQTTNVPDPPSHSAQPDSASLECVPWPNGAEQGNNLVLFSAAYSGAANPRCEQYSESINHSWTLD